jgi:hypothetical protein
VPIRFGDTCVRAMLTVFIATLGWSRAAYVEFCDDELGRNMLVRPAPHGCPVRLHLVTGFGLKPHHRRRCRRQHQPGKQAGRKPAPKRAEKLDPFKAYIVRSREGDGAGSDPGHGSLSRDQGARLRARGDEACRVAPNALRDQRRRGGKVLMRSRPSSRRSALSEPKTSSSPLARSPAVDARRWSRLWPVLSPRRFRRGRRLQGGARMSLRFSLLEPIAALTPITAHLSAHRALTDAQNAGDAFLAGPRLLNA